MRLLLNELLENALSAPVPREMELSSWLMLFFAILVLLGGLTVCIRIAILTDRRKGQATGDGDA